MFQTQNYTIIWCDKCQERTIIEPGRSFDHLNCKCEQVQVKEEDAGVKPRATRQAKKSGESN